jgi:transposase
MVGRKANNVMHKKYSYCYTFQNYSNTQMDVGLYRALRFSWKIERGLAKSPA